MYENFREPELDVLVEDPNAASEWKSLCEALMLEGQLSLVNKATYQSEPIPYMALNLRWHKILKTLCPTKIDYKKYNKSTIPLEALQEISLCVENRYFDKIEIWYNERDKDPFIVGILNGKYTTDSRHFLIGRFGDELLPFEILESKAIEALVTTMTEKVDALSKTIKEKVNEYLNENVDTEISIKELHGRLWY